MGLTRNFAKNNLSSLSDIPENITVALAGNPNVGKSTLFNNITGMNQHTGNWPGKTVSNAVGYCNYRNKSFTFIDIPGTYSLISHSPEEEIARNFLIKEKPDITVVVCEAISLKRNLNLVLQILEITKNVIVCINLMDEAEKRGLKVNREKLQENLGVPVIMTNGHEKDSKYTVLDAIYDFKSNDSYFKLKYDSDIEEAVSYISTVISQKNLNGYDARWLSLRLLENQKTVSEEILSNFNCSVKNEILSVLNSAKEILRIQGKNNTCFAERIVATVFKSADTICNGVITEKKEGEGRIEEKIDRILTCKLTGIPIMLTMLALVFWITISLSNYPSKLLSELFLFIEGKLKDLFIYIRCPDFINSMITDGIFHVVSWVVSVMLPPMAIFFPLFTVLEDIGILPRIAYNLDLPFYKCSSCGKQALTMCMGFGCNAAGVVGCRIIDSPKERMLAILTNNFVPCNGRFPALISVITMFIISNRSTFGNLLCALILTAFIAFSILITMISTKFLSKTLLKGEQSSYTLELPPYRKPQILKTIYRSVFDRTLFVLGRAVAVAAPTGFIIWGLNNISVSGTTLLLYIADLLDGAAKFIGLDGAILLAFILGFPANEIVLPLTAMIYTSQNKITEISNLQTMRQLFITNNWTVKTAVCVLFFFICHWPCSTTLITIKKETKSWNATLISFVLPTLIGIIICAIINLIF